MSVDGSDVLFNGEKNLLCLLKLLDGVFLGCQEKIIIIRLFPQAEALTAKADRIPTVASLLSIFVFITE